VDLNRLGGDIVKPLKRLLPDYQRIERDVEAAVFDRFGLPAQLDPCVKRADMVMLRTELRDFMGVTDEQAHRAWALPADVEPLQERLFPMPPRHARDTFLARFHELFDQMKGDRDAQPDVQRDLPQDRPRLSMG
jgi:hypothetical protein